MDPVTIGAVLAAIAGGAGGALGSQLWTGVCALVRRPFRRTQATEDSAVGLPSGEAELASLQQAPADLVHAVALAEVLVARAEGDSGFRQALEAWWAETTQIQVGGGSVANTVSGGTFSGPVVQGRDFIGLTVGSPATLPPTQPHQEPGRA